MSQVFFGSPRKSQVWSSRWHNRVESCELSSSIDKSAAYGSNDLAKQHFRITPVLPMIGIPSFQQHCVAWKNMPEACEEKGASKMLHRRHTNPESAQTKFMPNPYRQQCDDQSISTHSNIVSMLKLKSFLHESRCNFS